MADAATAESGLSFTVIVLLLNGIADVQFHRAPADDRLGTEQAPHRQNHKRDFAVRCWFK